MINVSTDSFALFYIIAHNSRADLLSIKRCLLLIYIPTYSVTPSALWTRYFSGNPDIDALAHADNLQTSTQASENQTSFREALYIRLTRWGHV